MLHFLHIFNIKYILKNKTISHKNNKNLLVLPKDFCIFVNYGYLQQSN